MEKSLAMFYSKKIIFIKLKIYIKLTYHGHFDHLFTLSKSFKTYNKSVLFEK